MLNESLSNWNSAWLEGWNEGHMIGAWRQLNTMAISFRSIYIYCNGSYEIPSWHWCHHVASGRMLDETVRDLMLAGF